MAVTKSQVRWVVGLIVAIVGTIAAYLSQSCSPSELQKAQTAVEARAAICSFVLAASEPRLEKARVACRTGNDVEAALRSALQCSGSAGASSE
jgi:hypothetical protein